MLLEHAVGTTALYIQQMPKAERKKYGQFFTSETTAQYMARLFDFDAAPDSLHVLDAGAGSGILSIALLDELSGRSHIKKVELTCYENDANILPLLQANLAYCKQNLQLDFSYRILQENYITSQYQDFNKMSAMSCVPKKYDMVIGNPPYKKISKDAPEAVVMPEVCHGAPNLYFLFASMGVFNLCDMGEMIYIIPRSWTSGAYFKYFREYFLRECKLRRIHLFVSREKVFDEESVLQETMIIKVQKTQNVPSTITISSSNANDDFDKMSFIEVPYNLIVSGSEHYVYLVTNDEELSVLRQMQKWKGTLHDIGAKMKTGLTVDFRNREVLRDSPGKDAIPLFYSQHIHDGIVNFPVHRECEYVIANKPGLRQSNRNYLFVKRFTSKEEKRRLQCGIYLAQRLPQYRHISTQNKINFIDGVKSELSVCSVYGLYALFNSSLYDMYYRILNGSTQVNSTEVNSMPVPDMETIQKIGRRLMESKDLSEANCDRILEVDYGRA